MAKIHPLFPPAESSAGSQAPLEAGRDAHPRLSRAQLQAALDRIPRAADAPAPRRAALHLIASHDAPGALRGAGASLPQSRPDPAPAPDGAGVPMRARSGDAHPPASLASLQATLDRISRGAEEPFVPAGHRPSAAGDESARTVEEPPVPAGHRPSAVAARTARAAEAPLRAGQPAADPPRRRADLVPLLHALAARARPSAPARARRDRDEPPHADASGTSARAASPSGRRPDAADTHTRVVRPSDRGPDADPATRAGIEDLLAVIAEQNRAAQDRLLQAEVMLNRVERIARDGDRSPAAAPSRARRLIRMVLDLNVTLGVLLICSFWLGPPAALRIVGYGMWAVGAYLLLATLALAWCGGVEDLVERTARVLDHPRLALLRRLLPAGRQSGRAAADALLDFTLWAGAAEAVFLSWFLMSRPALP